MLNLHRDKKIVRREPGRDGKILSGHRQDGNDEVHRLEVRLKKKKKKKTDRLLYHTDLTILKTISTRKG